MLAAQSYGGVLSVLTPRLQDNKAIVTQAVKNSASAYEHASDRLKEDPDIISEYLKHHHFKTRDLSKILNNNRALTLEAVRQDWRRFYHINDCYKRDPEFILACLRQSMHFYRTNPWIDEVLDRKTIALALVEADPYALKRLKDFDVSLCSDPDIVRAAVTAHGEALEWVDDKFRADKDLVYLAVTSNGKALRFALGDLNND